MQRAARLGDAAAQIVGPDPQPRRQPREAEEGEGARVTAACRAVAALVSAATQPPSQRTARWSALDHSPTRREIGCAPAARR